MQDVPIFKKGDHVRIMQTVDIEKIGLANRTGIVVMQGRDMAGSLFCFVHMDGSDMEEEIYNHSLMKS